MKSQADYQLFKERYKMLLLGTLLSITNSLSEHLELPTEIDNDANATALAELWVGEAQGIDNFLLLTLGTGIGGGIVTSGKIVRGATGLGAELGHIGIYPDGETCGCGKKGCLEAHASATGMIKTVKRLLRTSEYKQGTSELQKKSVKIDAKLIFDLARKGDPIAVQVVKESGTALGMGIGTLLNIFNPKKVILAGRMSQSFDLLSPHVWKGLRERAFEAIAEAVTIETSSLETNAGLVGAAAVFVFEHNLIREKTSAVEVYEPCTIAAANIGVSGMRIAIVSILGGGKSYQILSQKHIPGRQPSEEAIWKEVTTGFTEVLTESRKRISDLSGFVITTPGPIDKRNKHILNSPNMNWQYVHAETKLRKRIKGLTAPVYLERDAIAMILAELYFGRGRGLKNFAVIYLGTGVGASFVFDGRVFLGAHDQAGEIGHGIIDRRGTQTCRCGNRGCLECYASGVALSRYCASDMVMGKPTSLSPRESNGMLYYIDVVKAAEDGDGLARGALLEMGQALAIGVSTIVNYLDLEKIIISGPLSRGSEYFLDKVREGASKNIIISDWNKENIITTAIEDIEIASAVASFIDQHPKGRMTDQHRTSSSLPIS
jgi:glucokinase-like ROK family protein